LTILDLMTDLFTDYYFKPAESWAAWRTVVAGRFALPPGPGDDDRHQKLTGRASWPAVAALAAWLVFGRPSGKSRMVGVFTTYLACFRDWSSVLAPGEVGTVAIIAADREQARTIMRYIRGFLAHPMLASLVESETEESITLSNRIVIEVHTASFSSVRGYTLVAAICDETALWRSEDSANPDSEILADLRAGLATTKGLLLCIGNPYARRGEMWKASQKHAGRRGAFSSSAARQQRSARSLLCLVVYPRSAESRGIPGKPPRLRPRSSYLPEQ
jgi:hypothetical protein